LVLLSQNLFTVFNGIDESAICVKAKEQESAIGHQPSAISHQQIRKFANSLFLSINCKRPPRHPPVVGCHPSGGGEYFNLFCTIGKSTFFLNN